MSEADERVAPGGTPALGSAIVSVVGFLVLFHYVGVETWSFGKETFARMLGIAGLLLLGPWTVRIERRIGTSRLLGLLALAFALFFAVRLGRDLRARLSDPSQSRMAIDIAQNTYEAGTQFLAGRNPYTERCQLGHPVTEGPHVTRGPDGLEMYGLRYPYGFPYFPAMMLAYLPFRASFDGYHAIRAGNAFYLLLATLGVAWLAARAARPGQRTLAVGLSTAAYLAIDVLPPELFQLAVTDVCIAAVAVLGYVALTYDRAVLAGILLGLSQAAKLLPGPLLLLPAMAFLPTRNARLRLGIAYLLTSAALVLPALARAPEEFVASTIAFYLTYHGEGDDTSLYWFLPPWAKAPFLAAGFGLAAYFALRGFRRRGVSAAEAAGDAFLAYFLFTAFNRMTHLNYLWGIHSLGAVAIACQAIARGTLNETTPAKAPAPPPRSAPPA